jgi:hypothetical protein
MHEACVEHLKLTDPEPGLLPRLPLAFSVDDVADGHVRHHPPVRLRLVHQRSGERHKRRGRGGTAGPQQPWVAHAGVAHLVGRVVFAVVVDVLGGGIALQRRRVSASSVRIVSAQVENR